MSETMISNPVLIGPRDTDGLPYVWLAGLEQEICHDCAVIEFCADRWVDCIAVLTGDDPGEIVYCDFCGQPIDDALRAIPDDCAWLDALQDAIEAMSRDPQFAFAR